MPVIYKNTVGEFKKDHARVPYVLAGFGSDPGAIPKSKTDRAEFRAWSNSLARVTLMLMESGIEDDCGVLIEYQLPSTSRRVDFIVTGHDEKGEPGFVVVELKQWSWAGRDPEGRAGIVIANTGNKREGETNHPCYQALSYKNFLDSMLECVPRLGLRTSACAFMHNYVSKGEDDPLAAAPNRELVREAPLFGALDEGKLGDFIRSRVGKGKGEAILEEVADGKLVPSTRLIDTVSSLFKRSSPKNFVLIDEQKLAYETVLAEAGRAGSGQPRRVVIVEGGPGTGKSVVAMSALVELLKRNRESVDGRNIRFVSPTSSFREAMIAMLCSGDRKQKKDRLIPSQAAAKNLFCGSMGFYEENRDLEENGKPVRHYRALLVDEAHRLHSRQNMYRGKNQIEDIIEASDSAVFFVDDSQALRPTDIGSVESIRAAAEKFGASVKQISLAAQFRCAGAEGFLNWVSDVLRMNGTPTANASGWDRSSFDFGIADTPEEVVAFVREKNEGLPADGFSAENSVISGARLLAGYAWKWTKDESNQHGEVADVRIGNVALPWNNAKASYRWAVNPATRGEVGCVHTSQGLEFEYVGVFIGKDLRYDKEKDELRASYDDYFDAGGKNCLEGKTKAEREKDLLKYVCRCYRVLLSRGIRGARVYCCDRALSDYLKARLARAENLGQ